MHLLATAFPGEDGNGAVVLALNLELPEDGRSPAAPISIDVRFFETRRMAEVHAVRRDVTPSEMLLAGRNVLLAVRADLPPGRYHIRAAANAPGWPDAASVFGDVVVPPFSSADLTMSDLVLASAAADGGAQPDVAALVPFVPSARRVFDRPRDVVAFVRLHGSGQPPQPAQMEVEVRRAEGQTVFTTEADLPAARIADPGGAPFEVRIPTGDLPDGRYIVSVRARVKSSVVERTAGLLLVTPEKGGR